MFHPIEKPLSALEIAQQVLNKVRATIQYSSNDRTSKEHNALAEQNEKLNTMRAIQIPHQECSLEWIQEIARLANHFQVGNCCEKSCLAFIFLIENTSLSNICIELFNNPFIDHFFLVLNRDPATDESNPLEWNKDIIICDPWADRRCYQHIDVYDSYIMSSLLAKKDNPSLYRTVFFENDNTREARMQACFVLRNRWYQGTSTLFNLDVPMCYEAWDLEETQDNSARESPYAR